MEKNNLNVGSMLTIKQIIRWWFGGSKFPMVHLEKFLAYRPDGFGALLRDRYRTWIYHPIRRRLAKYYLVLLKKLFGLKVVAVTGSAGKTSTKDMLVSILSIVGETVGSYKNIDPVFNIPTTILKCRPLTKFLVLEFGVEYPGEMEFYFWLAEPDVGVVTNVYPTHIEFFGDVSGVAKEKSKIVGLLKKGSCAVINSDNEYTSKFNTHAKKAMYGSNGDIKAKNVSYTKDLKTCFTLVEGKNNRTIKLPFLGEQFVYNCLAAVGASRCLGIKTENIVQGIESVENTEHRMQPRISKSGAIVIDDTYNNNPQAAEESLKVFAKVSGKKKKIVVMADMLELGSKSVSYHRSLGGQVYKSGARVFIGLGDKMRYAIEEYEKLGGANARCVTNKSSVVKLLKKYMTKGSFVLIKGSRYFKLDEILNDIIFTDGTF